MANTKNFFNSIGREYPLDSEYTYILAKPKKELAMILISFMIDNGYCDFYGFDGRVNDADLILDFDVNTFYSEYAESDDTIADIISKCDKVIFIPQEGHMTVEITIKNFYNKVTHEEAEDILNYG